VSDDERARVDRPVAQRLGLTPAQEVAAAALNRARAGARARGLRPGQPVRRRQEDDVRSSPARDGRDPALVGDALDRLAAERGWRPELSVGGVVGRWREVVGDQVAEHCQPETFEDGLLVVRTDSTTWATQVRLLIPQLLVRLGQEVGDDVVRDVRVVGPTGGRGWSRGPRRVPGRGPRDTYG
jgi:predicted nucleic acid-binding Zn ribbon protein